MEMINRFITQQKFFNIKTFSPDDSNIIYTLGNWVYFDEKGNLKVKDSEGNTLINFINPLINKNNLGLNEGNISQYSLQNTGGKTTYGVINNNTSDPNYCFSPALEWILYRSFDEGQVIYYIAYNFIHRPAYKNFYINNTATANATFNTYCNLVNNVDPTCTCTAIRSDDCMKDLLGSSIYDKVPKDATYQTAASLCQDISQKCLAESSLAPDRNFLNTYYQTNPRKQNVVMNLCSTNISAGDDISVQNLAISCKNQYGGDTQTNEPTRTNPSTTTPSSNKSFLDFLKSPIGIILIIVIILVIIGAIILIVVLNRPAARARIG